MIRFFIFLFVLPLTTLAQSPVADSLPSKQLEEVVVTATRNERNMGDLPMPVTLVPKTQIKAMGSLRLNDVLTEQTGLVVVPQVNAQGNGIQLQGFNPDYTLILIDGEPIIGRYTGSLELSRITVGNIKQIEIVKGPSSSLYGSDALAGVINIITERPTGNKGSLSTRYGANNTLDVSGDVSLTKNKIGVYLFGNRYSTDGYDLSPKNFGKTVSPFTNYTLNSKVTYKISPATDFSVSGRYFTEDQQFRFEVDLNGDRIRTEGNGTANDWNFNPVLTHRFSQKLKTVMRLYTTRYNTETNLTLENDGSPYYHDDLRQTFTRPEINAEYFFNDKNILTIGAGYIKETVRTSRYGDETTRQQETSYGFFQHEWLPVEKLSIIIGGRFDYNTVYGKQFSPKFSTSYSLNKRISIKGSFGGGFKAPDFRQLYQNFSNSTAGGYTVKGAELLGVKLNAERSFSLNLGGNAQLVKDLTVDVNLYYNSINNLIDTYSVGTTAGQPVYSYRNILRAYTQGIESNLSYPIMKDLSFSLGYQLLFAKDKDVAEAVKNGNVYYRDPNTLITKRLKSNEYFGLYNRSRHQGNVKLFYNNKEKGLEASLRVIYRGKFGIGDIRGNIQGEVIPPSDRNSNGILDVHDDFVKGYALVNISAAKKIKDILRFQIGIDNLFDRTDPIVIPNLPGRLYYASIAYSFSKNKYDNQ